MKKTGRRRKLTPEFIEEAKKLISAGNTISNTAAYLGICEASWYAWIVRGEKETSGIYTDFARAMKKSLSVARISMLSIVTGAAREGNWQAAAWYLERTDPDNYGRRDRIKQEITGKNGGPIHQETTVAPDLSKLSDEQLSAYREICATLRGDANGGEVPSDNKT